MNTHRTTRIFGQAALVALLAAPLGAQMGRRDDSDQRDRQGYDPRVTQTSGSRYGERQLFTWRGNVDAGARIYIRGDMVRAENLNGNSNGRGRARAFGKVDMDRALPRRDGTVRVELLDGRGRVDVVQQPSARNDYTAILQVRDWRGGKDRYRLVAYFQPSGDYRSGRDGRVWGSNGGDVNTSGTTALHWSGNVDGDLRISLWRGQLSYQTMSGMQPSNVRAQVGTQSRATGYLSVDQRMGRGTVQVIEQPSQYNNYTAVVRVLDQQGGYGYYDFDLLWQ